ncbi:hypothetical protein PN836_003915 [Ningiella sp. W23]|uniref:hypothetical protein n=1 Tax=Ningiella sp. W23 TaxID=3023715 RepID=UPI0037581C08
MIKFRILLLVAALIGLAFFLGYRFGFSEAKLEHSLTSLALSQHKNQDASAGDTQLPFTHPWLAAPSSDELAKSPPSNVDTNNDQSEPQLDDVNDDMDAVFEFDEYQWQNTNDIVAMFNELMTQAEPTTDEGYALFSQMIDQFRTALADSPEQLNTLLTYMMTLEFESRDFHYITSIVQGLTDGVGQTAMQNTALQLAQRSDQASQQQFLHLVSSTYQSSDDPEILNALVGLALYSDADTYTKLHALDLVMPFQVNNTERQQILSGLNTMLDEAPSEGKSAILSNVLRFSSSQQRENLARTMISRNNDIDVRYSILDNIHTGVIPKSADLKNELMNIAVNTDDPMQEQAKHALMYVFDISNEEYQRINQGQ